MEEGVLNKDYRTELSRWVKLMELITTYSPGSEVKRSIKNTPNPTHREWTKERLNALNVLRNLDKKDLGQVYALFVECSDIIIANYSTNVTPRPDLIDGIEHHVRQLWCSYIPQINPVFYSVIPEDLLFSFLLKSINITSEQRNIIRSVFYRAVRIES